jgi:Ca2+-binding EF-hand superfamily protein
MLSEARKEKFIKDLKNKLNEKSYGSVTEETVLVRAFKYFDLDNTGKSDLECFLKTINKIGVTSFEEDEIVEMFHIYDTENTGEIDYKEFASELFANKSLSKKQKKFEKENQEPRGAAPPEKEEDIQEPVNNNQVQGTSTKKEYLSDNSVENILNVIREKLNNRGVQGICSLSRNFRIVDENNTQTIDFNEFQKACKTFNFGLDENQMRIAFVAFDRDNTGEIDYDEFIRSIRGEMNEFRQKLVQQAFDILDVNKNGEITFEEIKNKYNPAGHPDVLSGKKTEEEVLKGFMNTFQETYNYLCGTESDNVITIEEFQEYYENVSMTIDDDAYFELLMNNAWKMGLNTTYNNDKKSWNKNDENVNLSEKYQEKFGDKRPGYNPEEEEREKNEYILIKFINEIRNLGSTCLISLFKQFKANDENNTKELELYEFSKSLQEFETELNDDEIASLFNYFDKEKTGVVNYVNFINAIRGPMSPVRIAVVKEAFKKLDEDKSGQVEISEIKLQFNAKNDRDVKSGKKTEEEAYTEFVDSFQMNHDNRAGPRNKRVTYDEFQDYYNFVSMGIEDDSYFVEMVQNSWKINPYYSKVSNPQLEEKENEINDKNVSYGRGGNLRNQKKRVGAASAPFGTDLTPLTEDKREFYFSPEMPGDKKAEASPVEKFRNTIKKRGVRGVMAMRRAFMIADENDSKTLNLPEFIKFCHDYRIPVVGRDINLLFEKFDKDRSGEINYEEFIYAFVGEMNDRRRNLIKILFDSFDKNKTGFINLDEVRNSYSPKNHPDVLSGKKTEDEVLAEFLDTLQYHFSLLKSNKEEKSNKIGFDEFLEYFNNISVGIEDDDYFEDVIKSGFALEERRPKKKGWKSIV